MKEKSPLLQLRHRVAIVIVLAVLVTVACNPHSPGAPTQTTVDSTAALQARLNGLTPGSTLKLDRQVYRHSGVIRITVPNVHIDGNGATLQAQNDATSAVQILADGVTLSNVTLTARPVGRRFDALDQHKLVIEGRGVKVSDITIRGSAAAGIFVYGAHDFTIDHANVRNTRADGVHITNGSTNGLVSNVYTSATGDDGVAVVSYDGEPRSSSIDIRTVTVDGTRWARGVSVVGGEHVRVRDITVSRTVAACLYIATEGSPFFTQSVNDVTVARGKLNSCNTSSSVIQAAVLVVSAHRGRQVTGVGLSDLDVSSTPATAQRVVGVFNEGGIVTDVTLRRMNLHDNVSHPFQTNVPTSNLTISDWTVNGLPTAIG